MTTKRPLDIHDEAVLAPVKILYIEYQLRQPPKKPIILSQLKPDVEITIFDDVYHLHSSNITKASPFFKTSLSARWWKPRNTHRGPDGIKYKYSLVLDTHELDSNMGILEPVYSGARQVGRRIFSVDVRCC